MHLLYLQQVLHLPENFGNSRSFEFAKYWASRGNKVSLITSHAYLPDYIYNSACDHYHLEGIDIYVVPTKYTHMMSFSKRLLAFISFVRKAYQRAKKIADVDVVVAYTPPLTVGELGRRVAHLHRCPLVLEIADVWPDVPINMRIITQPLLQRFFRNRATLIYQQAALLLAFSIQMKQQLNAYEIDPTKVKVVCNGPNIVPQHIVRRKYPINGDPLTTITVLYAGTIGIANGLLQLVDVAYTIQHSGREDIRFLIVGEGNQLKQVKRYANELGCDNIEFHRRVAKHRLSQMMEKVDIGLVCFAPYPILEANGSAKWFDYMAFGLPVIINYKGWQADYLDKFGCGLSSPMGDQSQWVANILHLADHPDRRQKMGENGQKLVFEHFLRPRLASQSLVYIKEMLTRTTL